MRDIPQSTIVAAYLAHPRLRFPAQKRVMIDKDVAKEIYGILAENKVLLRTLNSLYDSRHDPTKSSVLERLVAQYRRFSEAQKDALRLRQELSELARAFQRNSLALFFVKSFSGFPLDSDNFDILVREKDLSKSRDTLADLGFVEIAWEEEPYKYLFRRVIDGEDSFAVHLHTRVAWEGCEFVDVDSLWKERREVDLGDSSVFMPSASHHLLVTLAHAFFENRSVNFGDIAYVFESIENVDWHYVMNHVASDGWSRPFEALLLLANHVSDIMFAENILPSEILLSVKTSENSLARTYTQKFDYRHLQLKISTSIALTYYLRRIFSNPHTSPLEKVGTALSLLNRGVRRRAPLGAKQPAFLVCFSGVDASGKTTQALSLWEELRGKDTAPPHYVWSRGFGQSFEPILYFLRRIHNSKSNDSYHYERRHTRVLRYESFRKLWAHLILLDHVIQVISKVKMHLILGDLVISDRYIQDTYVDARCELGTRVGTLVQKLTEQFVPKPDVVLYLDATAEEIAGRRQDVNFEEIECKRANYLRSHLKERTVTIDASDPLPQNKKKIVDIVLRKYYSTPARKKYYHSK